MSVSPPQSLLDRIAHALDRIEVASARAMSASGAVSGPVSDARLPALEARHASLRRETAAALADLNSLIAGGHR